MDKELLDGVTISNKLYTEEEMEKDSGTLRMKMTPNAIPDIGKLIERVFELLEFIDTDEMLKMERENGGSFTNLVNTKFEDMPYSIVRLLMDRENRVENMERLLVLFEKMRQIKEENRDIDEAYEQYTEELREQFLYPQYGGKSGFEQKMLKKQQKQSRKKGKKIF